MRGMLTAFFLMLPLASAADTVELLQNGDFESYESLGNPAIGWEGMHRSCLSGPHSADDCSTVQGPDVRFSVQNLVVMWGEVGTNGERAPLFMLDYAGATVLYQAFTVPADASSVVASIDIASHLGALSAPGDWQSFDEWYEALDRRMLFRVDVVEVGTDPLSPVGGIVATIAD